MAKPKRISYQEAVAESRFPRWRRIKQWIESISPTPRLSQDIMKPFLEERARLSAERSKISTELHALDTYIKQVCPHPRELIEHREDYWEDDWSKTGYTTETLRCTFCDTTLDTHKTSTCW